MHCSENSDTDEPDGGDPEQQPIQQLMAQSAVAMNTTVQATCTLQLQV
jgi:hypothetical protein